MGDIQQLFDLKRILIGDLPILFFVEIVFRTAVMYLYALFIIRMMGKRTMGQMSAFECTSP